MSQITITRKTVLLATFAIALAASTAAIALDQSRINMARDALLKAAALVQAAGADRAGHTAKAIADINGALAELNAITGG